jgi:hypothetical protein
VNLQPVFASIAYGLRQKLVADLLPTQALVNFGVIDGDRRPTRPRIRHLGNLLSFGLDRKGSARIVLGMFYFHNELITAKCGGVSKCWYHGISSYMLIVK